MDHPSAGAAFIHFSRPVGDMVYWSGIDRHADDGVPLHFVLRLTDEALVARDLPNFQYYVVPFPDEDILERTHAARQGMRSLRNVAKRLLGRDVASVGTQRTLQDDYCDFIINADELALDRAIGLFSDTSYGRALLRFEAEERPVRSNFVTLDQTESDALGMPHTVLNWATTEDDLAAIRETAALFGGFVGAEGIGRLQIEDHGDDPFWGTTTAWHQLGCMRMAESPTAGVVDPDCRLHGSQGVYVASGAVFPTGGRANPTLTIVALSIRLADHLKSRIQT